DLAHPRSVLRCAVERVRRGAERASELSGAGPGARPRTSVELARRAHALAADHSASDRSGAQARPAGAVDAVPDGRSGLPGPPSRMAEAFFQAGIPREAISVYPGEGDVGAAVLDACERNLIFGGTATVDRYRGNPRVQAHGPGFSKILLGDDQVDQWEKYLDL